MYRCHTTSCPPTDPRFFSAMARHAKIVNQWDFERIIPCHGVSAFSQMALFTEHMAFLGHHRY